MGSFPCLFKNAAYASMNFCAWSLTFVSLAITQVDVKIDHGLCTVMAVLHLKPLNLPQRHERSHLPWLMLARVNVGEIAGLCRCPMKRFGFLVWRLIFARLFALA
jgi:hypothetical protein